MTDTSLPTFQALREREFPHVAAHAYLDHASDSPNPARTRRVIEERAALLANPLEPVHAREDYLADANSRLGDLLSVPSDRFVYLTNTSDTTATLSNGIDWTPGDNIVLVSGEFPSFALPWKVAKRNGAETRFVRSDGVATDLDRIEAAIDNRTKVVAISHVDYQSGYRNELTAISELAHRRDALFVVDASQSLGVLQIDADANGIDALVSVGYKWLMAPHGIAVLYLSDAAQERITPTVPGRHSIRSGWRTTDYELDYIDDAGRYQGGALNWIGVCALAESLGLLTEVGPAAIEARALELTDRLIERLHRLPVTITSMLDPAHRSAIVTFTLGSEERDDALVDRGRDAGVLFGRRGRGVRIGTHFWNDESDLDRLIELIELIETA